MIRIAALIAASVLAATPAVAATYSAKPVVTPTSTKIIGKDIAWHCAGDSCRGATDTSRPLVICQDLARKAGRLESFSANGQALSGADLEKCNAKAKGATTALAHAN